MEPPDLVAVPELVFMLLVPEPMLEPGLALELMPLPELIPLPELVDPELLPEPIAPLLEPVEPELPELMLEVSVEGIEDVDMGDGVLVVEGTVAVSSVFLLQAPSASNADRAMAVARPGLSLDANISVSF